MIVREGPTGNSKLPKKAWGNGILDNLPNLRVGSLIERDRSKIEGLEISRHRYWIPADHCLLVFKSPKVPVFEVFWVNSRSWAVGAPSTPMPL